MAGELLPWADQQVGIGGGSSDGPSICAYKDRLYAVWKGVGSDERLFWSSFDGSVWSAQQPGVGGGSSHSPSVAVFQDRLYAAWKGVGDDQRLFWSSFDGSSWSDQQVGIGGGSSDGPSICAYQGRLYAVWKGVGTDERLFWSSFDGSVWSEQQPGVGGGSNHSPGLAVFQNRLYAAWKGVDDDQRLFWSSFDGSSWSGQQVGIGGGSSESPSIAVYAVGFPGVDDRLFAAWHGVNGDDRMFWSMFDGATWTDQQAGIGGGTSNRPSLAAFGPKLFAAWKGVGGDERMFWSSIDILRVPLQPILVSPSFGAANEPARPPFAWVDPAAGTVRAADTFVISVTTPNYPQYDFFAVNDKTTKPAYTIAKDLNYGQDYIWRVTPFNGQGLEQFTGPHADGKFSVQKAPAPPPPPPPPPPSQPICYFEIDPFAPISETFDSFVIIARGFQPNETVYLVALPNEIIMGTQQADSSGSCEFHNSFIIGSSTTCRAEAKSGVSNQITIDAE